MRNEAFVDIETSWSGNITITGVYRPGVGCQQLIGSQNTAKKILSLLKGVNGIYTYNGSRFDLPVIYRQTGLNLESCFYHRDLMYDCWKKNLYGGLKRVEVVLGISRDTQGITGIDAMNLWERYKRGEEEALEVLLRYNREDVENLEILASKLKILERTNKPCRQ